MDEDDEFTWFMKVVAKKDPTLLSPQIPTVSTSTEVEEAISDVSDEEVPYDPETDPVLAGLLNDIMNAPATTAEQARVDAYHVAHAEKLRLRAENEAKQKEANIEAVATALKQQAPKSSSASEAKDTSSSEPSPQPSSGRTLDKSPLGAVVSWAQTSAMVPTAVRAARGEHALQQHMMLHMALTQDNMSAEEVPASQLVDRRREDLENMPSVATGGVGASSGLSTSSPLLGNKLARPFSTETVTSNDAVYVIPSHAHDDKKDTFVGSVDGYVDNCDDEDELSAYLRVLRQTVLREGTEEEDAALALLILERARTLARSRAPGHAVADDACVDACDRTALPLAALRVSVWARAAWAAASAVRVMAGSARGLARVRVEDEEREVPRASLGSGRDGVAWMCEVLVRLLQLVVDEYTTTYANAGGALGGEGGEGGESVPWRVAAPLFLRHLAAHMHRYVRNALLARFALQADVHYSIEDAAAGDGPGRAADDRQSAGAGEEVVLVEEAVQEQVGVEGELVGLCEVLAVKHACRRGREAEEIFFSCVIELNEDSPEINADVD